MATDPAITQPSNVATSGSCLTLNLVRYRWYPSYRHSCVECLGDIPAHWDVLPLGRLGDFSKGTGGTKEDETSDGIPCVRYGDLYTHHEFFIERTCSYVSAHRAHRYTTIRFGDLLFAASGETVDEIGKSAVNLLREKEACCGGDVILFRAHGDIDTRFLGYAAASSCTIHQRARLGRGITVIHIYIDQLKCVALALPPRSEQSAIAAFLDGETAKIDALVAKKERLLELLREKRDAFIAHAVTKGLDPTFPMDDSGVPWIGKTPAHWDVKRVKWGARMESGHTPDKKVDAYWKDGDIPWVSLNDTGYLKNHDYIGVTEYCTNEVGLKNSSARLLPPRSVVLSRDATIGLCAITERPMAVSQHFVAWICSEDLTPEYLLYVFGSMQGDLERLAMGATLQTIGMPDVKTLTTPVPPVDEQTTIVNHIRRECSRLGLLADRVQRAIDHLKELRAALISAAVTGKIDVRSAA